MSLSLCSNLDVAGHLEEVGHDVPAALALNLRVAWQAGASLLRWGTVQVKRESAEDHVEADPDDRDGHSVAHDVDQHRFWGAPRDVLPAEALQAHAL
eukprot:10254841-Lingulodinium_polyedra.AAC.1